MSESATGAGERSREASPASQRWTVQALLDWATQFFKKQNLESPHLEAELLLAYALECKRIELYLRFENVLNEATLAKFKDAVIRRSKHEPLAYITGLQSFFSLEFKVTTDVLIPRPDTESLVEAALLIIEERRESGTLPEPFRIVDVGTGSGAIAVCLAKFVPTVRVLGIDISEAAVIVAAENALRLGVSSRCSFAAGSLLAPLSAAGAPLVSESPTAGVVAGFTSPDLIVANLPYVTNADYEKLAPGIRQFEPESALRGGEDGLDIIRELIQQAGAHLAAGGGLLLEIGVGQAAILQSEDFSGAGFVLDRVTPDLAGKPRVAWLRKNAA